MRKNRQRHPIILLVDECAEKNSFIKNWLELNDFSTRQTIDIFDVLDEIADFTMQKCPDVFMLPVNSPRGEDFNKIEELVQIYSDSNKILVATVSDENEGKTYNVQQFAGTEANLNALLPALSRTATAAVL